MGVVEPLGLELIGEQSSVSWVAGCGLRAKNAATAFWQTLG